MILPVIFFFYRTKRNDDLEGWLFGLCVIGAKQSRNSEEIFNPFLELVCSSGFFDYLSRFTFAGCIGRIFYAFLVLAVLLRLVRNFRFVCSGFVLLRILLIFFLVRVIGFMLFGIFVLFGMLFVIRFLFIRRRGSIFAAVVFLVRIVVGFVGFLHGLILILITVRIYIAVPGFILAVSLVFVLVGFIIFVRGLAVGLIIRRGFLIIGRGIFGVLIFFFFLFLFLFSYAVFLFFLLSLFFFLFSLLFFLLFLFFFLLSSLFFLLFLLVGIIILLFGLCRFSSYRDELHGRGKDCRLKHQCADQQAYQKIL